MLVYPTSDLHVHAPSTQISVLTGIYHVILKTPDNTLRATDSLWIYSLVTDMETVMIGLFNIAMPLFLTPQSQGKALQ